MSAKRLELRIAIEHRRGVEGWFQHEAIVALENAYYGDLGGRVEVFGREALRDRRASTFDRHHKRRPFDLFFETPGMGAALKLYLPWKSVGPAAREVRRDLVDLREHPEHGFLIAGRLDFEDGLTDRGNPRRTPQGGEWLLDVVRGAQEDMRLKPLVPNGLEWLKIELPPMRWWWPDETKGFREPYLALGGWSVWR